jgi:hypothetical protein
METTVIEGVLRIAVGEPLTHVHGAVRLEDVSAADALSSTRAEAPVTVEDGSDAAGFRLVVEGPVDPRRRYVLRAELSGRDAGGAARSLGSTQSYPWRPDAPAEQLSIDVRPWS